MCISCLYGFGLFLYVLIGCWRYDVYLWWGSRGSGFFERWQRNCQHLRGKAGLTCSVKYCFYLFIYYKMSYVCPNLNYVSNFIFHFISITFTNFAEVNCFGWKTKVCFSSCWISQGRGWKAKVCVFFSALSHSLAGWARILKGAATDLGMRISICISPHLLVM